MTFNHTNDIAYWKYFIALLCLWSLFYSGILPIFSIIAAETEMQWIQPSEDGKSFVFTGSGKPFIAWGVNYDHDESGRLLEDYWDKEWATVIEDFHEIKELGANLVRVHLQVAKFMNSPEEPNKGSLRKLAQIVKLAEETGLYLDLTGLGCYHKQDVPEWYDKLEEDKRWNVQALFWESVAKTCSESPAVFCYDLMNEPILPGGDKKETDWLAGEFGGKYFVQRISLDLAGRTQEEVAKSWIDRMAAAIRKHDNLHMITIGEIPWALTFPGAKSLFHKPDVGQKLDFVSVHFYPKTGEVDKALTALSSYDIGKPLLVEEMFPLSCGVEDLNTFIDRSRQMADGWVGFYWGKPLEEYDQENLSLVDAIKKGWLEFFYAKASKFRNGLQ